MLGFFNALSPMHLLLMGVVALLIFGNRLPEVARSLGRAINEFQQGLKDVQQQIERDPDDQPEHSQKRLAPPTEDDPGEAADAERKPRPIESSDGGLDVEE